MYANFCSKTRAQYHVLNMNVRVPLNWNGGGLHFPLSIEIARSFFCSYPTVHCSLFEDRYEAVQI